MIRADERERLAQSVRDGAAVTAVTPVAASTDGVPEGVEQFMAGADVSVAQGALSDAGRQLATLIGRPPMPLAVVVADVLK